MASLRTWDSMLPDIAPFVPGVPDALLRTTLALASSEFLARSYVWLGPIDAQDTVAGQTDYYLTAEAAIENVLWLAADNVHLRKMVTQPRITLTNPGRPTAFWMTEPDLVNLSPAPDDVYTLTGGVVLKTTTRSGGVPVWVYDNYGEAIVDGATWRLMRIPGKTWSNIQTAHEHKTRFDRAIMNANTHSMRSVELRVKHHPF